ncbi:MAG: (d)CMP kinase [Clostridiaceae bacterium]|nr:(d)CMP kinase [Clostridiaceae bacterium]
MASIAIDGPAGAGKSTIAKCVAKELGFIYVDTGAMYRSMALYFLRNQIPAGDEEKISEACRDITVSLAYENGEQQVLLNGENVNAFIRTEEVSRMTSDTSKYPKVREKLLSLQRDLAKEKDVIMDGRDIGTCVLPDADLKIYLTASSKERARRRYLEQRERGIACELDQIEKDIIARDEQDMNRAVAPLRQAEDAVLVDASDMTIREVVEKFISLYREVQRTKTGSNRS